jgi:hypothetical protein
MRNNYPEKPEVRYQKTQVEMGLIISYLKQLPINKEAQRSVYVIFRIESANGTKGLNNNYAGVQADSGRWPEKFDNDIIGVVTKAENGTGKTRLFIAFASWKDSVDFLVDRVLDRQLYVGGDISRIAKMHISSPEDLVVAYQRSWVKGLAGYDPTENESSSFLSMYRQAAKIFI